MRTQYGVSKAASGRIAEAVAAEDMTSGSAFDRVCQAMTREGISLSASTVAELLSHWGDDYPSLAKWLSHNAIKDLFRAREERRELANNIANLINFADDYASGGLDFLKEES